MSDRPILFSAPMVLALLDGRKTQTRRIIKPQPYTNGFHFDGRDILCHNDELPPAALLMDVGAGKNKYRISNYEDGPEGFAVKYVGDRLWVREAHYRTDDGDYERAVCAVDDEEVREHLATVERLKASHPQVDWSRHARLRPGIHMPRWASRLTLVVTNVKVERLQDISEEDAQAEGIERIGADMPWATCFRNGPNHFTFTDADGGSWNAPTAAETFRYLWWNINGEGSWEANPWVAAISFTVHQTNIDRLAAITEGGAVAKATASPESRSSE